MTDIASSDASPALRNGGQRTVFLSGLPSLAELHRTVEDLDDGVSEDWWQIFDLVAAWRFVASGVWFRLGAQQAVKLCVDVQDGILIVGWAAQENPRPLGGLDRHDPPYRAAKVLTAEVIGGSLAVEPVGKGLAAAGSQIVQEALERLGVLPAEPADLLFCSGGCEDFSGHAQEL